LNELYKSALPEEQKLLPWDLRAATVKEVIELFYYYCLHTSASVITLLDSRCLASRLS